MKCNNCGKERLFNGQICNFCKNEKSKDQKTHSIVFIIVIFLFFLFWKCSCTETKQESTNRNEGNLKFNAYFDSQECVKKLLKSPSTAIFPSGSDQFVTKIDDDTYLINSYVDSQNSFGAMLRTNYVCKITLNSNDTYTCDSIELLE